MIKWILKESHFGKRLSISVYIISKLYIRMHNLRCNHDVYVHNLQRNITVLMISVYD